MSPPAAIDAGTGPAFVLKGRVVTMNGGFDVLPDARLCIERGVIAHVLTSGQPVPDPFRAAPIVDSKGTIFPGLIELHNHLPYNALPPWVVPRRFGNRGEWPRHPDYRRLISGPASVLGRTRGQIEALTRFVEAKCLVAGVTTSQGITLSSNNRIRRYFRGVVRNVEQTGDRSLPQAQTRVPDIAARDAQRFLKQLDKGKTWLLHLSEGVDARARAHFQALQIDERRWAIRPTLAGIHCAGLRDDDFDVLQRFGGSMIWSPLSNLLLYGNTADIRRASRAGLTIALGSDWSPSGSKSLLGELKVAHLWSEAQGGVFSARELVAMATTNPARILRWHEQLGSIAPGRKADLLVVARTGGDPYDRLIAARDADVTLVVIDGWPRYGAPELMAPFPATESKKVAGEPRRFNFAHEAADPLVRDLTLGDAEACLSDGLARLPELAALLESPIAAASVLGAVEPGHEGVWVIDLDHEDHDGLSARPQLPFGSAPTGVFATAAAEPLSQILQSMHLDALTVADDERWAGTLASQSNLDPAIRRGLARAYGRTLPASSPVPGGGSDAQLAADGTSGPIRTLRELLDVPGLLTLDDCRAIVDQALTLVEGAYVHLPLKRAMHAVDPVQRLRLLADRLGQTTPASMESEWEFHREMTSIFASLRDLHTSYLLPEPYRNYTAYLPFLVEEFTDESGLPRYLVSKVAADLEHPTFQAGVEVLYWSGSAIHRVVAANAAREAGSNVDARIARGLSSLTVRPLIRSMPPDEEWVTLTYRDRQGTRHEIRRRWLVRDVREALPDLDESDPDALARATALGLDIETDLVNETRKALYASSARTAGRAPATRSSAAAPSDRPWKVPVASSLPWVFQAARVSTKKGEFAYIRLFTFNVPSAEAFVSEFCRLLTQLPPRGLILDVRGNGGGLIFAAEQLLQVLTPNRIEPEPAELATTSFMLRVCRAHAPSSDVPGLDLSPWIPSMEQALQTGATYSVGYPITPPRAANAVGQRYNGPVVLVTDGLCYSATDMFAAGFQDHGIGPVLGVGGRTGAGGANVWTSQLLGVLARGASVNPLPRLPHGAGFTVAVRRTLRVGPRAGTPVEDLGIEPAVRYAMTRRDLLESNRDLIERAAQTLAKLPMHAFELGTEMVAGPARPALAVSRRSHAPTRRVKLRMRTSNLDRVDVLADGRPVLSIAVDDGPTTRTLTLARTVRMVEVLGFRRGVLAAARRVILLGLKRH
jgi:cytosine/adenosine deaminase-related metal-dependent hydrolase